jgi:putative glutamine amidotransferase
MHDLHSDLRLAVIEVASMREHAPDYDEFVAQLIGRTVSEAESAGWQVSRHAAADLGAEALLEVTDKADAIVILGGEDIHPRHYGEEVGYPGEGVHYDDADLAQIAVARRAAERATPLLGICRGHQVINVALGGTLIPDLGDESGHRNIDVPIEDVLTPHEIQLERSSTLALRLGGAAVTVQSAHHQAVGRLGEGLIAVGWSHDGHVEAIEHEVLPITGVQFHPEAPSSPAGQLAGLLEGLAREAERAQLLAA